MNEAVSNYMYAICIFRDFVIKNLTIAGIHVNCPGIPKNCIIVHRTFASPDDDTIIVTSTDDIIMNRCFFVIIKTDFDAEPAGSVCRTAIPYSKTRYAKDWTINMNDSV